VKEAELQAVVARLFQRFPELVGFSVQEARDKVRLSDIETFPCDLETSGLMSEIAEPLRRMVDEHPDARWLLRGRTFARTLH
jgi:hypothetical protein